MRPELAGSELFGHARGAFTNAVSARDGAAGLADGGVLFLDEIGELDGPLQAQLLRLIQERVYKRIGEDNWRSSDFRLICATNRDLGGDVRAGRFRQDLYYRITQWQITLPPLRDRRSDIPLLARHFLKENTDQNPVELSPELAELLSGMPLIGNVRELRNIVARMKDRQAGCGYLTVGALRDELQTAEDYVPQSSWSESFKAGIEQALGAGLGLDDIGKAAKDMAVEVAMNRVGSNLTHAARLLNVSPRTLQIRKAEEKRRNAPV